MISKNYALVAMKSKGGGDRLAFFAQPQSKTETMKKRKLNLLSLKGKEKLYGYLLIIPALLIVGGLYIYPSLLSILFSFSNVDKATFAIKEFVGLQHYVDLLTQPSYWMVIGRTLYFAGMIVLLAVTLSFFIALLLNQRFVGRSVLRMVVLLPWAVPPIVAGVMWGQIFHAGAGTLNALLRQLGIVKDNIIWLGNDVLALHVIILAEVWRAIPFITLFILAGLQNISPSLYEAAAIDGANRWEQFRHILFPLILPILIPLVLLQFSFAMKSFDTIFVLTRGNQGTTTLNYHVYKETFEHLNFGSGAASAYILFAITILFVLIAVLVQRKLVKGAFL